ncbi:MAG: carboxypeptidase regulatory-like domain-containing protein [Bryobacteraceae bacterium]|nr:carboxypeptidase regulatory-like domain-containing protein [Bryobacteraceae bacterium]
MCSQTALAQASSTGEVRGSVLDGTGRGIGQSKVTLLNAERGFTRSVESNAGGEFTMPLLPPGAYKMRVEAAGFSTKVFDGVEVRVGDVVTMNVDLVPGAVATEVNVTAEAAAVEVERTQQSNTVEQRAITNLPINKRNFLDFAVLAPGVVSTQNLADDTSFRPIQTPNSGLSFGGSNGRGNGFFIDGLENYNVSGGVRPTFSQEAAQEFQINRNSFSAEFGNASGGVVNIISKSGTNTWKGNIFGFLRHKNIQARNYFDPGKSSFTRTQAGATAGGALVKDKQFLFFAYEHLSRQETNFIPILQDRSVFNRLPQGQADLLTFLEGTGSPALVGLARQGRALLVPGNNPAVPRLFSQNSGNFPFSERNNQLSGKWDVRLNDNHSFFLRSNFTKNPSSNNAFGALDGFNRGRAVNQTDLTGAVSDTYIFNPRWIMETRAQWGYNRLKVLPNDPNGPEININGFGFFGRQIFVPYRNIERHYQALQNFSYLSGKHSVKFGWDINPTRVNQQSDTFLGGRFTFGSRIPLALVLQSATGDPNIATTLGGLLAASGQQRLIPVLSQPISALQSYALGIPELYQQGFGDPNYKITTTRYNLFVQDTWKVNSHLTLNGGLRYEVERHNPVVPRDYNNIGPRVGFAWSPGSDQKMAIRGGYGLYYSQVNGQIAGVADPLSGRFINQVLLTPTSAIFRDPRTSQFVTSATVFQTLTAQGVIGSRQISQADLAQFGIRVGPNLPGSVVFGIEPGFQNPWAHQASLEVERQIGGFAVSLGYNFNRAAHLARNTGRNVAYSGQRLPDGRPLFVRPNPLLLQINNAISDANSFYHAGILQVTKRFSKGFSFNFNQTYSRAIDESTDFNSDYSPQDQLNFRAERALSSFHQKHRTVFNAVYQSQAKNRLTKDWSVSPIFIASSWRPFNVLTGVDNQGDTYVNNKRPATLGRNMGQGPAFNSFDLRLSRRFHFGSRENQALEFLAEGFNLFNHTNFRTVNNIVGDVPVSTLPNPIIANRSSASTPLAYTSALDPRQFQFGLKLFW